ncbi:hypothetical protein BS78_K131200 [Paspalum vaginatum]|uniref:Uncharacterized protein n=1 Tax=Paspalum vaginatum TaxID=158149 RepID=A0A9W8CF77_9POAL|nr:hypothetical protein BS78_K131200 [Paspalum vaginatum]
MCQRVAPPAHFEHILGSGGGGTWRGAMGSGGACWATTRGGASLRRRVQAGSVAMPLVGLAAPPPQAVDRRGTVRPPLSVDASPALQSMVCRTTSPCRNSGSDE